MAWIAVTQVGAQVRIGAGGLCVIVAMAATALGAGAPAACWCLGCAVTRAAATTTLSATAAAGRALGAAGRAAAGAATATIAGTRAALAAATLAAALAGLVGADAFHHFGAGGLGGRLHHVAARGFACAAPDGLAAHGDGLGLFTGLGAKAFDDLHGDLLLGEALDVHHEAFFVHADQAHGLAGSASTARAANAVHVVFRDVGDFVVDDVRLVINVDAACSDIGGHLGAVLAALAAGQGLR